MLKAILFDLDDTLIDWGGFDSDWSDVEDDHVRGVHAYLATCVDTPPAFDLYKKQFMQRTSDAWMMARNSLDAPNLGRLLIETAVALGVPEQAIDLNACLEAYRWCQIPGTSAFPDVAEGLALLQSKGLRFGIVTNAFQPMLLREIELRELEMLDFFPECRFSAADVGYLKPHPEIFMAALACLGTEPEETIFIGDNPTADIAGAQAVGMRAVMRITPRRKPILSGVIVPDAAINSLMELPPILDEWFPGWAKQNMQEQEKEDKTSS